MAHKPLRPRFEFVPISCETLGRLFVSAIRYAIRADQQVLIEFVCRLLRECYLSDNISANARGAIVESLRQRHAWLYGPQTSRYDDCWLRLISVLVEAPDVHCAQHQAPDDKQTKIKEDDLVGLLSAAVQYALGRHSIAVGATCDWIRDIAPHLHSDDRASLASDIRCYLKTPRPDEHGCDDQSWRDALVFLGNLERQTFARSRPRKPRRR